MCTDLHKGVPITAAALKIWQARVAHTVHNDAAALHICVGVMENKAGLSLQGQADEWGRCNAPSQCPSTQSPVVLGATAQRFQAGDCRSRLPGVQRSEVAALPGNVMVLPVFRNHELCMSLPAQATEEQTRHSCDSL